MKHDMGLFLRFAEGCRCYMKHFSVLDTKDEKEIASGKPSQETIKRVFYMAYPELEKMSKKSGKPIFDTELLRQFYCFEHNRLMHDMGHMACMTFPGYIIGKINGEYVIELEPIDTALRVSSDINLKHGDWVLVHRMNIVEKTTTIFARKVADYIKKLGMDKHLKFPPETIKYLERLRKLKSA